jgi:hypothetical protein
MSLYGRQKEPSYYLTEIDSPTSTPRTSFPVSGEIVEVKAPDYRYPTSVEVGSDIQRISDEEKFVNSNGIIIILILIMIIAIIVIWLLGSKTGDTVTDGKKLPAGFPLYFVRNAFSSLSLVLLGVGIYLVSKDHQDFNAAMLIFLFAIVASCVMLYETYFQLKENPGMAALILSLSTTAILFMIFLSWSHSLWIKFFFFIPLLWFIFLLLETFYYSHLNGSGSAII